MFFILIVNVVLCKRFFLVLDKSIKSSKITEKWKGGEEYFTFKSKVPRR